MFSLIKNEFIKLFHKKGIYIVTIIFILYAFMANGLYKSLASETNKDKANFYLLTIDNEEITAENSLLDLNNPDDLATYSYNLSLSELFDMRNKYKSNNQMYLLDNFIFDLICEKNEAKYIVKDEKSVAELTEEINDLLLKVSNEDWKYFTNLKIKELKELITSTDNDLNKERYEERLKLNNYRLNNNISYDYENFINEALIFIDDNLFEYKNLNNDPSLNADEKQRFEYLKEEMAKNEYILKNKMDVNSEFNLNSLLKEFTNEFGVFILIYLILISGSIVSEEFSKGTIKYLLTKPYKRSTILLSKFLTILLILPFIIILMFLLNLLIGGLIHGYDSLKIPVLLYDNAKNILITKNIFAYNIKLILSVLPMYIILATFCFTLSTITASTSAAVTLTFAFYLIGNVISSLYLTYKITILKYFISLHWDFSYLANMKENVFKTKPIISLIIIIIYISVMLCLSIIYFNKKDVKNI